MDEQKSAVNKLHQTEQILEKTKFVNELNIHSLVELNNQIQRAQNTKAWKMMCLLRRFNEQFLKGSSAEKGKFLRWFKNKLLNQPITKDQELMFYSPIKEAKIQNIDITEMNNTGVETIDEVQPMGMIDTSYVKYNVPNGVDILRFPVIEWDFRWQRPQQMSVQFADNGNRVFYFSIDTLEHEANLTYEDVSKKVIIKELRKNVWWVKLCSKNRLNAYKDVIDDTDDIQYLKWSIDYIKERFKFSHSVSILDLPFWAPLVFSLENNRVIYDCMDDHAGFSTNSVEMLSSEKSLIVKADLVVTSSQLLYEKVKTQNKSTILVRNAGEYDHFASRPLAFSEEIEKITGPVIGYYGAISEWFDIQLIEQLAKRNPKWTFVLVGDTFGCDTSRAEQLPNVVFTGEKPYTVLPQYLHCFDVCVIPFLVNDLTLATNPVKVYEYLAAGKPVVSTRLPELEMIRDYVYLASSVEEFEQSINQALTKQDLQKAEMRKEFALDNTWHARFVKLNNEINSRFYPKVSIIIVTYNNWSYTKQCLDSLFRNNGYPNVEIIIVDNDSSDETRIQLARIQHPQLKVILSPTNTGFAGGNSIGCQAATGEYIILLNNDTIVPPGWLERLLTPLQKDPSLGMVGPMSNSVGNDQMLDHFVGNAIEGADPKWLDEFYKLYRSRIRYTELLGFFCVAMTREVYTKIGDLDVNYGIGMFEDDDYCERVRQNGYKLGIVEDAFVYHHGSVSFKKLENDKYRSIWEKNKRYFEQKWGKEWQFPKHPASLFWNAMDSESIAEAIRQSGKRSILILGEKNWEPDNRGRNIAVALAQKDNLVIVYSHFYHDKELIGTRKVGHTLYLTNRVDLFESTVFDQVLYCGESDYHNDIKAKVVAVDRNAYIHEEISEIITKSEVIIEEETVERVVDALTDKAILSHS
ncbi:glycosyltransferase [Brevibacillus migulae]|uniref:glycosyltransferase n=1 Tax=Brevibacillus migulae TaxID=1644114 RepID=UPI001431A4A5|nr:glycosyltransferase [Brevibacillus migulae]